MAKLPLPSPWQLRQLMSYEPETGNLFWLPRSECMFLGHRKPAKQLCSGWNTRYAGQPALSYKNNQGYRAGSVTGVALLSHRAIWAMVNGEWPEFIDHINGDRSDNRLSNLRAVTRAENNRNRRLNQNNTSGHAGVKELANGSWSARIRVDSTNKWIGTFKSKAEAIAARDAAERDYGFHANHGLAR